MLRDLQKGEDPQIAAIIGVIDRVQPDVLVLTDIDFDVGGIALRALSDQMAAPFPYQFVRAPNAGVQRGFDMDGNGYKGDARDGLGYGRFLGDGGMAILSRHLIDADGVTDLTPLLWVDVPGATLPNVDGAPFPSEQVQAIWPVSSASHWIVPIEVRGRSISLLAFSATAPVFDGPEDSNGLRNRDELRVWEAVLDGKLGPVPSLPVVIGNANADPFDGEGLRDGIAGVLARGDLQDPAQASAGGRAFADPTHHGDPGQDTADWSSDGPGNLRVSYVLPSAALSVLDGGVFWPAPDDPQAVLLGADGLAAGAHKMVWVDIDLTTLP